MSRHLMQACREWCSRPADERYPDLNTMYEAALRKRAHARTATTQVSALEVIPNERHGLVLRGSSGREAKFTNWSFGQLASYAKMDRRSMVRLPPSLASECMTYGLKELRENGEEVQILLHEEEKTPGSSSFKVRAFNGPTYSRVWDHEFIAVCMEMESRGWKVPPAYGAEPSGLYLSDRDYFIFMVNEDNRIDDGSEEGLARGFFMWGSEEGKASQGIKTFYYRYVCGNHIVWFAEDVKEVRVRHVGSVQDRFWSQFEPQIREWSRLGTSEVEDAIRTAQRAIVGTDESKVVDALVQKIGVSKKLAKGIALVAETHADTDGDPRSKWGLAQAVTRLSQADHYADSRAAKDAISGKILSTRF